MFQLINSLVIAALSIIEAIVMRWDGPSAVVFLVTTLGLIYNWGVVLPSIAVQVRRLHDIGRSGWWLLIVFVPLAGLLVLLRFDLMDSQPGQNQYGPNPKEYPESA
jgi:uncharacterized membrane protein YhaH (DUF805 family)